LISGLGFGSGLIAGMGFGTGAGGSLIFSLMAISGLESCFVGSGGGGSFAMGGAGFATGSGAACGSGALLGDALMSSLQPHPAFWFASARHKTAAWPAADEL
jgi:hypothetical protein